MTGNPESQAIGLSLLLQLARRVREAESVAEIGFIAVNETKQLVQYRQAALWVCGNGVVTVSGIPEPDQSSPYLQWLTECCAVWERSDRCLFTPIDMAGEYSESWREWAPANAAVVPLKTVNDISRTGMLVLFRDEPWQEHDMSLLAELASMYAHGLKVHESGRNFWQKIRKHAFSTTFKAFVVLFLVAIMFYPVRMSVQAPAEVVPKDPFVVRSPLDTVIDKFHVMPNQLVREGQLLFEFDRTNLGAKHGVASKAYQVAAEEYRQAAQTALVDDKYRAEITPRWGRMEEKGTELSFSRQLLKRAEVLAPRSGIVVFAEQSDWIGKNVTIGERVLSIADPNRVEMLIRLPVADAIDFELGTPVKLYLSSDPNTPLDGALRYAAYKPETTPAGLVVYRIKADIASSSRIPRIGLTGIARIYGKKVSLGYYLFRRPLTLIRQRTGW